VPKHGPGRVATEEEVLRNQLFAIAYGLERQAGLVEICWSSEEYNADGEYIERWFEVEKVVSYADELHPKVLVHIKEVWSNARGGPRRYATAAESESAAADDSDAEEHGEGVVRHH
jgi:hypothetical protein